MIIFFYFPFKLLCHRGGWLSEDIQHMLSCSQNRSAQNHRSYLNKTKPKRKLKSKGSGPSFVINNTGDVHVGSVHQATSSLSGGGEDEKEAAAEREAAANKQEETEAERVEKGKKR